ncbi:hypothetical protein B0T16DRAFT_31252 [Cercophora newfieldiana]|uniref:Uncharacterized protein n=1 Tax=Cercophora newfieldiana TaxID=92897 RepID=A0AA39YQT3_9PEZI|nr:hypothetical protein B0T16DRAFT_31252 [Cercophora newfieldiana]
MKVLKSPRALRASTHPTTGFFMFLRVLAVSLLMKISRTSVVSRVNSVTSVDANHQARYNTNQMSTENISSRKGGIIEYVVYEVWAKLRTSIFVNVSSSIFTKGSPAGSGSQPVFSPALWVHTLVFNKLDSNKQTLSLLCGDQH